MANEPGELPPSPNEEVIQEFLKMLREDAGIPELVTRAVEELAKAGRLTDSTALGRAIGEALENPDEATKV